MHLVTPDSENQPSGWYRGRCCTGGPRREGAADRKLVRVIDCSAACFRGMHPSSLGPAPSTLCPALPAGSCPVPASAHPLALPSPSAPSGSGGHFMSTAERIRLPDDCTIGYIVEALLGVPLIRSGLFHSHLENLQQVPSSELHEQVCLSRPGRVPGQRASGRKMRWEGGGLGVVRKGPTAGCHLDTQTPTPVGTLGQVLPSVPALLSSVQHIWPLPAPVLSPRL